MKLSGGQGGLLLFFLLLLAVSLPLAASQSNSSTDDTEYNYARLSPSLAIMVVVIVAALFFMAFFSIYLRHCSPSSNSASATFRTAGNGGRSRRGPRGLDQSVISTFPTLEYSKVKDLKIGKGALECAVCLCEFEDDETLRLIPKCDHVFHPDCIDAWLASHTTCPVCRANLVPQTGDPTVDGIPQLDGETPANPAEEFHEIDLEEGERREGDEEQPPPPAVMKSLNRSNIRRSRSSRPVTSWLFPRSHSTGHSLVQPGEDTERFTLRLPAEVRKQIVNRQLNRAMSMVVFPSEGSSRRGYRQTGDSSNRGRRSARFDRQSRSARFDRWTFGIVPNFFSKSGSIRSPRVAANNGEGTSSRQTQVVLPKEAAPPPV
ncbi:hypothetical protein SAY86_006070 [Trapa natans]|uniref:RING-type E3 ubiquitin transferase n=1 Tax=Trapa natans TaxID=22666 RepID=A0AAN7L315_TRANT|nr:hypothetical protein SAY86_006070 [Trapa natans]